MSYHVTSEGFASHVNPPSRPVAESTNHHCSLLVLSWRMAEGDDPVGKSMNVFVARATVSRRMMRPSPEQPIANRLS